MSRFVILTHDHPFLHWDLMLETEGALRTWRLLSSPDQVGLIRAEALDDHRLHYLDYEGPVSGNRGHVTRWDSGEYELTHDAADELRLRLHGSRLTGNAVLCRDPTGSGWTFTYSSAPR